MDVFWKFSAGLGLFLFGLNQLEDGLKLLASNSLKEVIKKFTSTPFRGIMLGTISTMILQSSSVVTVMLLAFVGSGILNLSQALGVILGANLGTTATGWIVSFFGFNSGLEDFIIPLLSLSTLSYVVTKAKKSLLVFHYIALCILGLSLIIFGLIYMKESMAFFTNAIDVKLLTGFNIVFYFLFGFVLTSIIQSSSASMMITLAALNSSLISLEIGAAIIIGADLGSSMTTVLGAMFESNLKRQIALAHFIFNLVVDVLALIFVSQLIALSNLIISNGSDLYKLVTVHSLLNLVGVILFYPFIDKFKNFIETTLPYKEKA